MKDWSHLIQITWTQVRVWEEYAQLHPMVPTRQEIRRVLVFFGGVDEENLTCRALEAMMDPKLADIAVDGTGITQSVFQRSGKDHKSKAIYYPAQRSLSLAGLITRKDLAIGATGTTTWERVCLGLPSLVTIAANQIPIAEALDRRVS